MNEDELLELNATLQEENESLKNQLSMIDFPPNEQLTSEKNFAMLARKDEIPAKYKEVFDYMMPPSMQWMHIDFYSAARRGRIDHLSIVDPLEFLGRGSMTNRKRADVTLYKQKIYLVDSNISLTKPAGRRRK